MVQSFGLPINISINPGDSELPQIAISGNNVYVVWDEDNGGNFDIFFAASNNNGTSFGLPINLSNNPLSSEFPQIAASGNNVYVTWQDRNLGNSDILYRTSNNNGTSFGSTLNISENLGFSALPQIAASGNNVYVTWQDNTPGNDDIFFAVSNNNGTSFGLPMNISKTIGNSVNPQIATSGKNVYVTWQDRTPGNNDIFLAASNNNGTSFGLSMNISNTVGTSEAPEIAVSSNNVYVTWQDNTPGNLDIFVISNDRTFGIPINISSNLGTSQLPQIAAS